MRTGWGPRDKGRKAEAEVVRAIEAAVPGVKIERGRAMSSPRPDLLGLEPFAIEVKRVEELALDKWWEQAKAAAFAHGLHPLLVYRRSRRPWRCMALATPMWGGPPIPADMALSDFLESYARRAAGAAMPGQRPRGGAAVPSP